MESSTQPKVTLRPLTVSDVDDFMVWASDEKVTRYCTWEPYTSKGDLLRYIQETVLPHPWFQAICVGGRPVGSISFLPGKGNERCKGELGYALAAAQWGKGVATAAVRLAVKRVFEEMEGLERVEALVDVENVASQRVLEKAGFVKEGVLRRFMMLKGRVRDLVMYSILAGDDGN